ncbi:Hint domain-containing protein [Roseovarius sp. TM1035]|uniref:Hint domain-containing protein n=1 Tax=Roseovarius sp. TM1035 TaxID=391613 RepID=UPI000680A930|nr:Hint domain-containing protein [Roseovarius sp. TM1035]
MAEWHVVYQVFGGAPLGACPTLSHATVGVEEFAELREAALSVDGVLLIPGAQVTLRGAACTVLGSGRAQPGIPLLDVIEAKGEARDLVLLRQEDTGETLFLYPQAVPHAPGMVALVVDLTAAAYRLDAGMPLGLVAGTGILTPTGERNVQTLVAGDRVLDTSGAERVVIWAGVTDVDLDPLTSNSVAPVRFEVGALGAGHPMRPLKLSPFHHLPVPEPGADGALCLGPALGFVGLPGVRVAHLAGRLAYHHLLLDHHALILANGTPVESLFPCPAMIARLAPELRAEAHAALAVAGHAGRAYAPLAETLGVWQTRDALALWPEALPENEILLAG